VLFMVTALTSSPIVTSKKPLFGSDGRKDTSSLPTHTRSRIGFDDSGQDAVVTTGNRTRRSTREAVFSPFAKKHWGKGLAIVGSFAALIGGPAGAAKSYRSHHPQDAVAEVFRFLGTGPVETSLSKPLGQRAFLMENGTIFKRNYPYVNSYTQVGQVLPNGLVTSQTGVDGAFLSGKWYSGDLVRGLQTVINNATDIHFPIKLLEGAAPSKQVDANGVVRDVKPTLNYFHQKQGEVRLIGDKKRPLTDQERAVAAAYSGTGAGVS
jgi:hypothetical protein